MQPQPAIDVHLETEAPSAFLSVRDLRVHFPTADGLVKSVDGLSFDLARGQILGIVGESGSGKSVTSQAILGLHKGSSAEVSGEIWFEGKELVRMREGDMRSLRGNEMSMIFQDPLSSLHPFYTIGWQIVEAYREHNKVSKAVARKRAVEMLDRVGIPNPDKRFDDYPHQFSGGMRQRAMIAMALVCDPKLLIADEPTTALDVTVQAQILELMKDLQREFNSAIILITHDLGVVAETCETVVVMYGGQCVEQGSVRRHLLQPADALHLGPARLDAAHGPHQASAAHPDPGHAAVADPGAERLCVPPALPLPRSGRGGVHDGAPRPRGRRHHRPSRALPHRQARAQPDLHQRDRAYPLARRT